MLCPRHWDEAKTTIQSNAKGKTGRAARPRRTRRQTAAKENSIGFNRASRTSDNNPAREFNPEIIARRKTAEKGFRKFFGVPLRQGLRSEQIDRTSLWRPGHADRILLFHLESHEIGWIIDLKGEGFRRAGGGFQRKRKPENHEFVLPLFQRIVEGRPKFDLCVVRFGKSEKVEFGERFDIGLGERRQLFLGHELAVLTLPLRHESRIHLVKCPGVANGLDLAFCVENHLRARRYPYVRVRRRILRETGHQNGGHEKLRTQTPMHEESFGGAFREAI